MFDLLGMAAPMLVVKCGIVNIEQHIVSVSKTRSGRADRRRAVSGMSELRMPSIFQTMDWKT